MSAVLETLDALPVASRLPPCVCLSLEMPGPVLPAFQSERVRCCLCGWSLILPLLLLLRLRLLLRSTGPRPSPPPPPPSTSHPRPVKSSSKPRRCSSIQRHIRCRVPISPKVVDPCIRGGCVSSPMAVVCLGSLLPLIRYTPALIYVVRPTVTPTPTSHPPPDPVPRLVPPIQIAPHPGLENRGCMCTLPAKYYKFLVPTIAARKRPTLVRIYACWCRLGPQRRRGLGCVDVYADEGESRRMHTWVRV